jgi:hypothetical protein
LFEDIVFLGKSVARFASISGREQVNLADIYACFNEQGIRFVDLVAARLKFNQPEYIFPKCFFDLPSIFHQS